MLTFEADKRIALFEGDTKNNQVAEKVLHKRRKWMRIAFRSETETPIDNKPYNMRWL